MTVTERRRGGPGGGVRCLSASSSCCPAAAPGGPAGAAGHRARCRHHRALARRGPGGPSQAAPHGATDLGTARRRGGCDGVRADGPAVRARVPLRAPPPSTGTSRSSPTICRATRRRSTSAWPTCSSAARHGWVWDGTSVERPLGGFAHFLPVIESGVPSTSPDRRGGAPHAWNRPRLRTGRLGAVRLSPDARPVPMVSGQWSSPLKM